MSSARSILAVTIVTLAMHACIVVQRWNGCIRRSDLRRSDLKQSDLKQSDLRQSDLKQSDSITAKHISSSLIASLQNI